MLSLCCAVLGHQHLESYIERYNQEAQMIETNVKRKILELLRVHTIP